MNFFEQQDRVRSRSALLIFYYGMGVVLIVAAVDAVVYLAVVEIVPGPIPASSIVIPSSLIVVAVILSGSIVGMWRMSGGGAAIAQKLGARAILPATCNADEKRLRNVVEEISIASGVTVPQIFVFAGEGINAFAAGTEPDNAAIAVSEGALQQLNRDEIQGVIAHEFSHIFNGDMRLSVRLIGIMNGLLLITVIGRILRASPGWGRKRNVSSFLGLLLVVIGHIGVLMSRIIKSAISRQREFLADASGVQFTRNPWGLLGALDKIRRGTSFVCFPRAEELSHLFFSDGLFPTGPRVEKHHHLFFSDGLFATHPPLEDRIKAIDPTFQSSAARLKRAPAGKPSVNEAAFAGGAPAPITPAAMTEAVASPTPADMNVAADVLAAIPPEIEARLHSPVEAVSVVYDLLSEGSPPADVSRRLPILELAIPALRLLPRGEKAALLQKVRGLARADKKMTPFELAAEVLLQRSLFPNEACARRGYPLHDAMCLLSYLAYVGSGKGLTAEAAFNKGTSELGAGTKAIMPPDQCEPETVRGALLRLAGAAPLKKQKLIAAVTACVSSDGVVTSEEWELLRVVCQCCGCPAPLLPPNQDFAATINHGRNIECPYH